MHLADLKEGAVILLPTSLRALMFAIPFHFCRRLYLRNTDLINDASLYSLTTCLMLQSVKAGNKARTWTEILSGAESD